MEIKTKIVSSIVACDINKNASRHRTGTRTIHKYNGHGRYTSKTTHPASQPISPPRWPRTWRGKVNGLALAGLGTILLARASLDLGVSLHDQKGPTEGLIVLTQYHKGPACGPHIQHTMGIGLRRHSHGRSPLGWGTWPWRGPRCL
jgi:hypothetical protein